MFNILYTVDCTLNNKETIDMLSETLKKSEKYIADSIASSIWLLGCEPSSTYFDVNVFREVDYVSKKHENAFTVNLIVVVKALDCSSSVLVTDNEIELSQESKEKIMNTIEVFLDTQFGVVIPRNSVYNSEHFISSEIKII